MTPFWSNCLVNVAPGVSIGEANSPFSPNTLCGMPTSAFWKVTDWPALIVTVLGPKVCIGPFFQIPDPGNILMVAPPAGDGAAEAPASAKSVRGSFVGALAVKFADFAN